MIYKIVNHLLNIRINVSMGVANLFKMCNFKPVDLQDYPYKKVGVDMYVILHKFVMDVQIAKQLVDNPNEYIMEYYEQIRRYLSTFILLGYDLYLVYDGNKMKYKITEEVREQQRLKCFIQENWIGAVEIVPQQMYNFQDYLEKHPILRDEQPVNIPYVVAPFEADAELTYLYKEGIVNSILTNDSDLIIYGVCHILMIRQQGLMRYDSEHYEKNEKIETINQIDLRKLWLFGYLIGCDYFKGVPKVGIVKAFAIISNLKVCETGSHIDWDETYKILMKNKDYVKAIKGKEDVIDFQLNYNKVRMVYTTQYVIDPRTNELKNLLGDPVEEVNRIRFGEVFSVEEVGKGRINPISGKSFTIQPECISN